jgi:tetratricopeptide (TPR) repeat protein
VRRGLVRVAVALGVAVVACGGKRPPEPTTAERLNAEGLTRLERGEGEAADDLFRNALMEAELVDDLKSQAEAWNNRGVLAFSRGDCEGAWRDHAAALRLHALRGVRDAGEVRTRVNLGTALLACGKRDEARTNLTEAEGLARSLKDEHEATRARLGLAGLALAEGRAEDAAKGARAITESKPDDDATRAAALALEGTALEAMNHLSEAKARFEAAADVDRRREAPTSVASDLKALARVAERAGDAGLASAYLLRASRIDRNLGALDVAARELARAKDLAARGNATYEVEAIELELEVVNAATAKRDAGR